MAYIYNNLNEIEKKSTIKPLQDLGLNSMVLSPSPAAVQAPEMTQEPVQTPAMEQPQQDPRRLALQNIQNRYKKQEFGQFKPQQTILDKPKKI